MSRDNPATGAECVHICWTGPTKVVREEAVGARWCFVCRKRVEFADRLISETGMSYYDPWWERTCPKGHFDGDLFPGLAREYA